MEKPLKVLLVLGTRPEIIKLYPIYAALKQRGHEVKVFFTKQQTTSELTTGIFKDFAYVADDVCTAEPPELTVSAIGNLCQKWHPGFILVQGDTWSVLQGTLAALYLGIPLGHVEAGLRSFDERMVEEKIRVLVDNVADLLFAPTKIAYHHLKEMGRSAILTGNTVFDLLHGHTRGKDQEYILVTLHRPETVDNPEIFEKALEGVALVAKRLHLPARYLIHPRSLGHLKEHDDTIAIESPASYLEFINLIKHASLIMTDSGGVQEEAAILKVPCVTIRKSTERPETVEANLNRVTGYEPENILFLALEICEIFARKKFDTANLYGEGNAAELIIDALEEYGK